MSENEEHEPNNEHKVTAITQVDTTVINKSDHYRFNHGDDAKKYFYDLKKWVAAIWTANTIIAFFTMVMAFTSYGQWMSMNKQNEVMMRQNDQIAEQNKAMLVQNSSILKQITLTQNEQRAWLGITTVTMTEFDKGKGTITAGFINTGRTPAYNVIAYSSCKLWAPKDIETFFQNLKPGEIHGGDIIMPDTTHTFPTSFTVDSGHEKEIQKGEERIYFFGKVTYQDVFNTTHTTTWCQFYDPPTTSFCPVYQKNNVIN